MNIGIFVHSQSGHSSALGMALTQKLRDKGHEVDIQLIQPMGKVHPRMKHVELREDVPDMSGYNCVVLGGPIWAWTASPVVCGFIKEIQSLTGKKAMCYTTSGFPTALSGARGAHKKLSVLLEELGADVLEGEIFYWGFISSKKKIDAAAERMCERITK